MTNAPVTVYAWKVETAPCQSDLVCGELLMRFSKHKELNIEKIDDNNFHFKDVSLKAAEFLRVSRHVLKVIPFDAMFRRYQVEVDHDLLGRKISLELKKGILMQIKEYLMDDECRKIVAGPLHLTMECTAECADFVVKLNTVRRVMELPKYSVEDRREPNRVTGSIRNVRNKRTLRNPSKLPKSG